jgi:homogentisate 1,2-dioxygenase
MEKDASVKKEEKYEYLPGFGNHFCTEAVPGSLPKV